MVNKIIIILLVLLGLLILVFNFSDIFLRSPDVSEEQEIVYGKLSELIFDGPVHRSEYYFISINGERYSLSEENYFNLMSQADKNDFVYVDASSLRTDSNSESQYFDDVFLQPIQPVQPAQPSFVRLPGIALPSPPSNLGEQKVIVILGADNNQTQNLISPAGYNSILSNEVNNFVKENSFNQTWLKVNVSGWHVRNLSDGCFIDNAVKFADPFVDYGQYDTIIVVSSCTPPGSASAFLGPTLIKTSDGLIYTRIIFLPLYFSNLQPRAIVAHEMGHGFGLDHASAFVNCNPPFHIGGRRYCQALDYGDPFDTMGETYYSLNSSPHYSARHKNEIGWMNSLRINSSQSNVSILIKPLEFSRQGSVYIHSYENETFPCPGCIDYFYSLDYRLPVGLDAINDSSWPPVKQGVYIRYHHSYQAQPNMRIQTNQGLIDTHHQTPTLADSYLVMGENYTDYVNRIIFKVNSMSSNGANVSITKF